MSNKRIKSLDKAVSILDCFYHNEELGITEIMNLTGMNKSTVYDLVYTLFVNRFLEQDLTTKKYRLGIRLFEFGNLYAKRNSLRNRAELVGRELAEKYSATVHLAVHDKGEVVYIDKFENHRANVSYSRIGKRAPMSCTGVGKAMLAFLNEDYRNQYIYSHPLPKMTEYSLTTKEELEENLALSKQRGYSTDDEEIELGIRCVAAPIFNIHGEVLAAISVSRFAQFITDENIDSIAKDVKQAAYEIGRGLS